MLKQASGRGKPQRFADFPDSGREPLSLLKAPHVVEDLFSSWCDLHILNIENICSLCKKKMDWRVIEELHRPTIFLDSGSGTPVYFM
jgi:hypothetical protein